MTKKRNVSIYNRFCTLLSSFLVNIYILMFISKKIVAGENDGRGESATQFPAGIYK